MSVKAMNHDTLSTMLKLFSNKHQNLYGKNFKARFDVHDS